MSINFLIILLQENKLFIITTLRASNFLSCKCWKMEVKCGNVDIEIKELEYIGLMILFNDMRPFIRDYKVSKIHGRTCAISIMIWFYYRFFFYTQPSNWVVGYPKLKLQSTIVGLLELTDLVRMSSSDLQIGYMKTPQLHS